MATSHQIGLAIPPGDTWRDIAGPIHMNGVGFVRTVLFDIGGVIFDEDKQYADMLALIKQSLHEIGIEVPCEPFSSHEPPMSCPTQS